MFRAASRPTKALYILYICNKNVVPQKCIRFFTVNTVSLEFRMVWVFDLFVHCVWSHSLRSVRSHSLHSLRIHCLHSVRSHCLYSFLAERVVAGGIRCLPLPHDWSVESYSGSGNFPHSPASTVVGTLVAMRSRGCSFCYLAQSSTNRCVEPPY